MAPCFILHALHRTWFLVVGGVAVSACILTCVGAGWRRGDQYKLTPVKLELHNGVDSLCKFRRETVDRLRLLARRVPREELLANTTAGVSGKFVLSSGRPIPFRKDVKKQKRLCLLAGELAGSVPVPAKVTGVAGNRGMLWCVPWP